MSHLDGNIDGPRLGPSASGDPLCGRTSGDDWAESLGEEPHGLASSDIRTGPTGPSIGKKAGSRGARTLSFGSGGESRVR